ncbi:hypothetical protein AVEN_132914-1 [Araneus ventricosus]|uniref:Uncharacterized protein n=1 Tax=Araneus ventricosus TaxID=182803 RepID=A0A4Y2V8V7_ARAVE|nr:hypothetical protein AVEN_132914-1 [Araneus ventricosus]
MTFYTSFTPLVWCITATPLLPIQSDVRPNNRTEGKRIISESSARLAHGHQSHHAIPIALEAHTPGGHPTKSGVIKTNLKLQPSPCNRGGI